MAVQNDFEIVILFFISKRLETHDVGHVIVNCKLITIYTESYLRTDIEALYTMFITDD